MTSLAVACAIFLILQVLDVWTTIEAMERGAYETNETIAEWMDEYGEFGWIKRKMGFAVFCLGVMAIAGHPIVINAVSVIYLGIVLWNVRWIIKLGD